MIAYKLVVKGLENIPKTGGLIICANHTSNADALLLAISMKRFVRFMTKSELYKNPLLAFFLRKLGSFPVKRKNADRNALDTSIEILKNGEVLGIFIEGTRSKSGELLRPKSGAAMIAMKSNMPILPVCITCAEKRGPVKAFLKTKIEFGRVIHTEKIISREQIIIEDRKILQEVKNSKSTLKLGGMLKTHLKLVNEAVMTQISNMKAEV
jgi:1-acyl-sn-glycerol-3-phosphate acyltransferase